MKYLSKNKIKHYERLGYNYEGYQTIDTVNRPKEEIYKELSSGNKNFSMVNYIKAHVFVRVSYKNSLY